MVGGLGLTLPDSRTGDTKDTQRKGDPAFLWQAGWTRVTCREGVGEGHYLKGAGLLCLSHYNLLSAHLLTSFLREKQRVQNEWEHLLGRRDFS